MAYQAASHVAIDQRELFQQAAPPSHHIAVQRGLYNREKAGVPYKCCSDVSNRRIQAAANLIESDLINRIALCMQMYSWRCNINTIGTTSDVVRKRFSQHLVEYRFPLKEFAKRYIMKSHVLHQYGLDHNDVDAFEWKNVDLAGFTKFLYQHGIIRVGQNVETVFNIHKDAVSNEMYIQLNNTKYVLELVQFLNSIGDAMANLDDELLRSVLNAKFRTEHSQQYVFSMFCICYPCAVHTFSFVCCECSTLGRTELHLDHPRSSTAVAATNPADYICPTHTAVAPREPLSHRQRRRNAGHAHSDNDDTQKRPSSTTRKRVRFSPFLSYASPPPRPQSLFKRNLMEIYYESAAYHKVFRMQQPDGAFTLKLAQDFETRYEKQLTLCTSMIREWKKLHCSKYFHPTTVGNSLQPPFGCKMPAMSITPSWGHIALMNVKLLQEFQELKANGNELDDSGKLQLIWLHYKLYILTHLRKYIKRRRDMLNKNDRELVSLAASNCVWIRYPELVDNDTAEEYKSLCISELEAARKWDLFTCRIPKARAVDTNLLEACPQYDELRDCMTFDALADLQRDMLEQDKRASNSMQVEDTESELKNDAQETDDDVVDITEERLGVNIGPPDFEDSCSVKKDGDGDNEMADHLLPSVESGSWSHMQMKDEQSDFDVADHEDENTEQELDASAEADNDVADPYTFCIP